MKVRNNLLVKFLVGTMMVSCLAGCGSSSGAQTASSSSASSSGEESGTSASAENPVSEEVNAEAESEAEEAVSGTSEEETAAADSTETVVAAASETDTSAEDYVLKVGSLKGPTTMGLVNLMQDSENGEAEGNYEFSMQTQPDELAAQVIKGDVDVALLPANVASVLYNKTEGGVSVIGINTLGVLDVVTGDDSVTSIADFAGRTVYSTGQGATPEYALNYLLEQYGVTDCTIEFKSEAAEVAAVLANDSTAVAVLPQPFATSALLQNDALHIAFSLTDAWDEVTEDGSALITGVTIVRNEILETYPEEVDRFLTEAAASAAEANEDVEGTAELVAAYGILEKAPVAQQALPNCHIVCITGTEMQDALSGYLNVLYTANAESVGSSLPGDDFYYVG